MKCHKIYKLLIALLFSIEVDAQNTQERTHLNNLPPDDQALVLTWVNKSCSVAEQNEFEKKINAKGSAFDRVFLEAYQLGPTEQEIKKIRSTAISDYRDRINWLQKFGDEELGEEETKQQLAVTEEQYAERVMSNYTNGYKTSALAGFGLVGTEQLGTELKKIADDPKNPAQTAAQEALKLIVKRNKSKQSLK